MQTSITYNSLTADSQYSHNKKATFRKWLLMFPAYLDRHCSRITDFGPTRDKHAPKLTAMGVSKGFIGALGAGTLIRSLVRDIEPIYRL